MASWYEERVLSHVIERSLSDPRIVQWRRAAVAPATGEVVEFGFGAGPNLPHYGPGVTSVRAVEPVDSAWARAADRIDAFGRPVQRIGLDGAHVAGADASVDTVVSSFTLCTIADLGAALGEARRLLRPGGRLVFVEHSLAPDEGVAKWQRRIQPVWGALAGGCHLDRDLPRLIADAGFDVRVDESAYALPGVGRLSTWLVRGTATAR